MKGMKKGFLVAAVIWLLASLVGCGGKGASDKGAVETMAASVQLSSGGVYESAAEYDAVNKAAGAADNTAAPFEGSVRKLIRTISMDVETEGFDDLLAKLKSRVAELGGYIESSNVNGNIKYDEHRYSNMTLRIPSERLDEFVGEVDEISNITRRSEHVDDITLTYVDMESRKQALEIEQERLLTLLEQAESVEDIIAIEGRVSEVRYELQSYASQLLVYDNQVEYSTVYLNISEVKRLSPQGEPTVWERISRGFLDNLSGAGKLLENLAVGIIVLVPYWGILVIVIVAAVFICRGVAGTQRKKKEQPAEQKQESQEKEASVHKEE